MFKDEAEIYAKAGNGGNGAVSFRREKYIPKGGPDGGDGGKGGDIIFRVDTRLSDLSFFNRQKRFLADNGQNGMGKNMFGKDGADLILKVPAGTQILDHEELLADLSKDGEDVRLLIGGKGGWGNQHFATSIKQSPKWAKDGMRGESKRLRLVFKTIADVGLVGLPNAGKSTLLSVLTHAKPKIADYPFTTLSPNLGTYIDKGSRIIFADIPGLIEGASEGKGLGIRFLRHIERTKIILHLIDASSPDPIHDYSVIRSELKNFSKELAKKPELVVFNKIETLSEASLKTKMKPFLAKKIKPLAISAATHKGLSELIARIKAMIF